jgi:hypothetical protein
VRLLSAALVSDARGLAGPTIGHLGHFLSELDGSRRRVVVLPAIVDLADTMARVIRVAAVGPRLIHP